MKSILLGASLLIMAVSAQDAYAQQSDGFRLRGIGKYAQVTTGDLVVPAGTTTSGSVMVIRGNLDVYGNVDGAATAILGDVIVHEGGRVRGGAVALMGHVRNEGGSILGVIKDVGPTHNRSTVSFGARPRTTIGSLVSAIVWLVVLLLMGTFVLFFMRDYFKRTVEVVTSETGRSLFTGVLAGLATVPALVALCIAMAITIIGIFFIPIGVAAFLVAVGGIAILGFLAVAHVAGIALSHKSESETPAGEELQYLFTGIVAFSALWIIAAAFTWFPILGSILRVLAFSVTFVAVATGFGAVILSWWRSRPKKNAVAV
ncbi:MAG TPA: hypothetical protein VGQ98_05690 [Gemmatimonadaceae bacterium]|nr:hypothetical protein [Gemmatimonadaceae bacterium]